MSATGTGSPEHIELTSRRSLVVVAMSAAAMVVGLTVRYVGSVIGDDTGAMLGIFVASVGSVFLFPALQTYLLERRFV